VLGNQETSFDETVPHHGNYQGSTLKVKGSLGQDGIACQQRFVYASGEVNSPIVVVIPAVSESHQEAGVRDPGHAFEKPFREERSAGPSIDPARRRNARPSDFLASSS
jgi:hypothetical protein